MPAGIVGHAAWAASAALVPPEAAFKGPRPEDFPVRFEILIRIATPRMTHADYPRVPPSLAGKCAIAHGGHHIPLGGGAFDIPWRIGCETERDAVLFRLSQP
jgi:hypothetical protein